MKNRWAWTIVLTLLVIMSSGCVQTPPSADAERKRVASVEEVVIERTAPSYKESILLQVKNNLDKTDKALFDYLLEKNDTDSEKALHFYEDLFHLEETLQLEWVKISGENAVMARLTGENEGELVIVTIYLSKEEAEYKFQVLSNF